MIETNIFKLLKSCDFIENNEYFEAYIELINNSYTGSRYSEVHHIFCKCFSKYLNMPIIETADNLVTLQFKDHCKAHWLLYKCTKGKAKLAMANAFISMIAFKATNNILAYGLTESDYEEIQKQAELIRLDSDLNYWKPAEILFLLENYENKGQRFCAKTLNRTLKAVASKASDLGLTMDKWWTEEDDLFLKNNYLLLGPKECAKQLNRTYGSTVSEAARLGITSKNNYSAEDLKFLKANYAIYGQNYCAQHLNRTPAAIKRKARELSLSCKQGVPIYCPELNITFSSIKEASEQLKISDGNICSVLKGRLEATNGYHFIKVPRGEYYEKRTY